MSADGAERIRGRPVLGAVSGLLFGVSVGLVLQQFGLRPLDSLSVIGLPLVGLALGLALAWWAPIRRRHGTGSTPSGG